MSFRTLRQGKYWGKNKSPSKGPFHLQTIEALQSLTLGQKLILHKDDRDEEVTLIGYVKEEEGHKVISVLRHGKEETISLADFGLIAYPTGLWQQILWIEVVVKKEKSD